MLFCVQLVVAPWTIACQAPLSIFQARILEWVAISSCRGSSQPRDQSHVCCYSCIGLGDSLPPAPPGEPDMCIYLHSRLSWWLSSKESTCNTGDLQKTQVQSLSWEDPLKKEMATHSSILAWEIPWTEEPGGLQSMGLQKKKKKTYRLFFSF